MSNSENPRNGAIFQQQVMECLRKKYHKNFELEKKLFIGSPAKEHKFDIVDEEQNIVVECKRYTWTETGNVPSAKMGFCNEAAFSFFLPHGLRRSLLSEYSVYAGERDDGS